MILQGKVVVISGIGPGLGVKLALEAVRGGARGVVLAARSAAKLQDAHQRIDTLGTDCEVLEWPTDILDVEQCRALVKRTVEQFGRIDCLVNSAYNPGDVMGNLQSNGTQGWSAIFQTNVFGTMNLALEVAAQMKAQGGGAMVMINSMVTRKPLLGQGGYAASKSALATAVRYMAQEYAPFGVRINTAAMGWMWGTPVEQYMQQVEQQQGLSVDEQKAAVASNIPMGSIPTDEDCAKAALLLVSDYTSAVTGAWLDINGGEYMAP